MIRIRWKRLRARLTETSAFAVRPLASPPIPALQGLLAASDADDKKAVLIGRSESLADFLGLRKARRLVLDYPDFTLENLALLSDEYDYVIADRALHLCKSLDDAASETMRVLKPGGWYVQTTGWGDFALHAGIDRRRLSPGKLQALHPHATDTASGRAGPIAWTAGRKAEHAPEIAPTINTRKSVRPWYRFRPKPAKFGIVAMMRNEAPYLLEWIAYHRLLGIAQITIYDNESNDASPRILGPLARAGIISVRSWRNQRFKQDRAYTDASRRLRALVEWCLFIDLDEFVLLKPGYSLPDLLPKEPDVSALAICWRVFGSSGLRNRDTGLTIERFLKGNARDSRVVKSMVRLKDLHSMSVHLPNSIDGRATDLNGRTLETLRGNSLQWETDGPARLNHYQIRSWEEFECKRARGRGAANGKFMDQGRFDRHGPGKIVLDEIVRFAPAVKEEVARLRKIVGIT